MSNPDIFDLSGRVSLVTGGSSGLGRAFCEAMAEKGSDVAFSYNTNEAGARETAAMVTGYGVKAMAIKADISQPAEVRGMFRHFDQKFGKLDILFNSAGMDVAPQRIHELPLEAWNRMIAVDLTGTFLCMQEGLKLMLRQKKGSIINISSVLGLVGINASALDSSAYVASKHGIMGLTKQAASEYAADGIRVNAIAPGFIPTRIGRAGGFTAERVKTALEWETRGTPMGRRATPSELKGIAIYLASDASSFVTGSISVVDGGYTSW